MDGTRIHDDEMVILGDVFVHEVTPGPQVGPGEAFLSRSEGCVLKTLILPRGEREEELEVREASCRLGRCDQGQRDGVQEACSSVSWCHTETVPLFSAGHGESPRCASGRGGTHGSAPSQ